MLHSVPILDFLVVKYSEVLAAITRERHDSLAGGDRFCPTGAGRLPPYALSSDLPIRLLRPGLAISYILYYFYDILLKF